jgi:amino acid permease
MCAPGRYTASRMLFSLGVRGNAPQAVCKIAGNGAPWVAVFIVAAGVVVHRRRSRNLPRAEIG